MGRLPVLIVAYSDDLHAQAVYHTLSRKEIDVEWIDFAALNKNVLLTLNLDRSSDACLTTSSGRKIMLSDVESVWWRRPRTPIEDPELDDETRLFVNKEWEHFLSGLEAFSKVRWINPPKGKSVG